MLLFICHSRHPALVSHYSWESSSPTNILPSHALNHNSILDSNTVFPFYNQFQGQIISFKKISPALRKHYTPCTEQPPAYQMALKQFQRCKSSSPYPTQTCNPWTAMTLWSGSRFLKQSLTISFQPMVGISWQLGINFWTLGWQNFPPVI